jgi:hypothetical protein
MFTWMKYTSSTVLHHLVPSPSSTFSAISCSHDWRPTSSLRATSLHFHLQSACSRPFSGPREIRSRVPQAPVPYIAKYEYKRPLPNVTCLFSPDCRCHLYVCDRWLRKFVFKKLRRDLNSVETWCERSNIKVREYNIHTVYFSHSLRTTEDQVTLTGRNIPFLNNIEYLCVILTEMIEAKAFRTFIGVCSLFQSEWQALTLN